jgi:hypothetical protein
MPVNRECRVPPIENGGSFATAIVFRTSADQGNER